MKRKQFPGGQAVRLMPVVSIRAMERAEGDDGPLQFEVAASSEFEVERSGWITSWREVLDHSPKSVQLSRFKSGRAAVLVDHEGDQVGVIRSARLDDDKTVRAMIEFSQSTRGREVEQDVKDGIRSNISIGYLPKRAKLIEESEDRGDLWRVTLWEPLELSLVGVPADPNVGVGRNQSAAAAPPVEIEEEVDMKNVQDERGQIISVGDEDPRPAISRATEAKRDRDAEMLEIHELSEGYGIPIKREWIERKLTPDQVAREMLRERATKGPTLVSEVAVDLPERDAVDYSYRRAILIAAGEVPHDGLEGEVDDEIRREYPSSGKRGILVPTRLTSAQRRRGGWSKRTVLDTKTPTTASELVFDRPGEFIDLFRNKSRVAEAGARILTGLVGNVVFPKKTGAGTVHWMPENGGSDVAVTNLTTGLLTLSPKTLMGLESYSRQFLVQSPSSGMDGEAMVRDDLATGHALAFDLAALHGSGTNGEPLGIYNTPDVLDASISGVPTFAELIAMAGQIADANAPTDNLKFMTTPLMAALMAATLVASSAGSDMIWKGTLQNGVMAGYPALTTNQVSKTLGAGAVHGIILGDWSEVILATWNAMELIVDPYAKKAQGLIEVSSFQMGDVLLRQPTAFSCATAAALTG